MLSFFCIFLCFPIFLSSVEAEICSEKVANFQGSVNKSNSFDWKCQLPENIGDYLGSTLRVNAVAPVGTPLTCPLVFLIQQGENIQSFFLPKMSSYDDVDGNTFIHYTGGRTICLKPKESDTTQPNVHVMITTCSEQNITFNFSLTGDFDKYITTEFPVETSVSPTSPIFFPFKFSPSVAKSIVLVEVRSEDEICMIVSVQGPRCPVSDQEETVQFKGKKKNYWQTMTSVSLMPITKRDFPDGFQLVFVVVNDNNECKEYRGFNGINGKNDNISFSEKNRIDPKLKNIVFQIHDELPLGEYIYPVFIPLALYLALIGFTLFLFTIFYRCTLFCMKREDQSRNIPNYQVVFNNRLDASSLPVDPISVGARNSISSNSSNFSEVPEESNSDQIQILRSRYNNVNAGGYQIHQSYQQPCVSDLRNRPPKVKKSNHYYWLTFIVIVFYCVPVFQLLATYEQILLRTGDNDLCYFNFNCAHPLWRLFDFNHVYSNVGYVLLGVFFLFLVYYKEKLHLEITESLRRNQSNNTEEGVSSSAPVVRPEEHFGTIQHYGIYYALGFALISEGALSAGYHVCPNRSNFQFDTTFMNFLAILCMVKIYQFRHPVQIDANKTFAALAILAVVSVLGLLVAEITVAIIFSVFHFGGVVYLQVYMYYVGYIIDDGELVTDRAKLISIIWAGWKSSYRNDRWYHWLIPKYRARILLPVLIIPFNVAVIVIHFCGFSNFASHLLYIFVGNLIVYMTYYIIMKTIHLEFISLKSIQPLIYIPLAVTLWIFSLQYFTKTLTSWDKSPSQSREENRPCIVMEFFDTHDMWHFLSAGALYTSFLMLLTLEDSMSTVPQRNIPVF